MDDAPLTIKTAAQQTSLSAHVIRIWEKRYGAVSPLRTDTNRRLYSPEQVERLRLLARLTQEGRSISTIARLPTEALRALVRDLAPSGSTGAPAPDSASTPFLSACIHAVRNLDAAALESELARAVVRLGLQGMMQRVVAPLAREVGDLWRDGTFTAAHEHFATAVLRTFLARSSTSFAPFSAAPVLLAVTPSGQLHELGALLVCATASNLGWRVIYLGASLPAPEIAGAALQHKARAVALSLVYPEDDPALGDELVRLRSLLPPDTALLAGGRATPAYAAALDRVGALQARDLAHLGRILDGLRKLDTIVPHA